MMRWARDGPTRAHKGPCKSHFRPKTRISRARIFNDEPNLALSLNIRARKPKKRRHLRTKANT